MRSLDSLSWPARRWLADRLVGQHAYSRNVAAPLRSSVRLEEQWGVSSGAYTHTTLPFVRVPGRPFDQERI